MTPQAENVNPGQAGDIKAPTLWTVGKPETSEYYYDGAYPSHVLEKLRTELDKYWPPDFVDLSSVWISRTVTSDLILLFLQALPNNGSRIDPGASRGAGRGAGSGAGRGAR